MTGEANSTILTVQTVQALLLTFQTNLAFDAYRCPTSATISNVTSTGAYDFIVVGGGTAGLIVATRLSECSDVTVLVLESGGCPPLEANALGYFPVVTWSAYDHNYTSTNDGYACQNLQNGYVEMTAGNMLGGSSLINHGIKILGGAEDFTPWATAAGDGTWNATDMLYYSKKSECVYDEGLLASSSAYHGTSGVLELRRQNTSDNDCMFDSYTEMGITKLMDTTIDDTIGAAEPLMAIGKCGTRQSSLTYLTNVKRRTNLSVLTGATVSKINFDSSNVATGVTFTYSGSSYTVTANKEVILSAGAVRSPQILMLSGVGPSATLTNLDIDVVYDAAGVGQNLHDHPGACVAYTMETASASTEAVDPYAFPVPVTCVYNNSDSSVTNYSDYQAINLIFPPASTGLLELCVFVFKYKPWICDLIYAENLTKKVLYSVLNKMHPESSGSLTITSTSISDQPEINLGLLSNSNDLTGLAGFAQFHSTIVNTTYFSNAGSEVVDLGLCSDYTAWSDEYWQCYTLAMSSTMWHYSGTCSMGNVTDSRLLVNGVTKLRVVDASVMPSLTGGNIGAAVEATAEKAADLIKTDHSLSCSS